MELLHTEAFAHRHVHTHTLAFTRRSLFTEQSIHIFYHVSFFMIIHDLSSSYLRIFVFMPFWSTPSCSSFRPHCRLVFMPPRVLSSALRPRSPNQTKRKPRHRWRLERWNRGTLAEITTRNIRRRN